MQRVPGAFGVVARLAAQPVAVGEAEVAAQAQVGIGGDGALTGNDVADTLRRDIDVLGEAIAGDAHRLHEVMQQDLTGMDGRESFGHGGFLSGSRRSRHRRSEKHTSELQSLMRISYAVFCLKKKKTHTNIKQSSKHSTSIV